MVLDSQKRYADTAEFSCRPHPTSPIANILTLLCLVAQSCLTLCNPMDCSPPASSVHGNPTGKNTRVGCHALLNILHSVQFSRSVVSDSLWPHGLQPARPPCPSSSPGACQTPVHRVGDAIQPSHPLSPPLLPPSIPPSIRVFSNESILHVRWPKYWSFSFSISPSSEHPGLISFRMDWLDLLAAQGTWKLQKHLFFGAQFSLWSSSLIRTWLLEKNPFQSEREVGFLSYF